jgi:hypothetical protein
VYVLREQETCLLVSVDETLLTLRVGYLRHFAMSVKWEAVHHHSLFSCHCLWSCFYKYREPNIDKHVHLDNIFLRKKCKHREQEIHKYVCIHLDNNYFLEKKKKHHLGLDLEKAINGSRMHVKKKLKINQDSLGILNFIKTNAVILGIIVMCRAVF